MALLPPCLHATHLSFTKLTPKSLFSFHQYSSSQEHGHDHFCFYWVAGTCLCERTTVGVVSRKLVAMLGVLSECPAMKAGKKGFYAGEFLLQYVIGQVASLT